MFGLWPGVYFFRFWCIRGLQFVVLLGMGGVSRRGVGGAIVCLLDDIST